MGKRKDGIERKARLLEAATRAFAEKGFRETTVADICAMADSNTASVNYYFGSKEELYAAVWKNALQVAMEKYPPDMGITGAATPEEALQAFVRSLVSKILGAGQLGYGGQILLREVANPIDALECVKNDALVPMRMRMIAILKELLGPRASEQQIAFCVLSVVHQCLGFAFKKGKLPPPLNVMERDDLRDALIEHITRFSLAGIAVVKAQIQDDSAGDSCATE